MDRKQLDAFIEKLENAYVMESDVCIGEFLDCVTGLPAGMSIADAVYVYAKCVKHIEGDWVRRGNDDEGWVDDISEW